MQPVNASIGLKSRISTESREVRGGAGEKPTAAQKRRRRSLVRRTDANWEGQGGRTALRSKFTLGQPFGGPDN